jgi:predicted AAA+ superfamily ATPase
MAQPSRGYYNEEISAAATGRTEADQKRYLNRHNEICAEILSRRVTNDITEEEDENLSDEAAEIWYQMNRESRDAAKEFIKEYRKSHPEVD